MPDKTSPFYRLASDVSSYVKEQPAGAFPDCVYDFDYGFDGRELSERIRGWSSSEVMELSRLSGTSDGESQMTRASNDLAQEDVPPGDVTREEFAMAIESAMWTVLESACDYWAQDEDC